MDHKDMRLARDLGPVPRSASRGGMLQCRAQDAPRPGADDGGSDQAKQQFRAAFAHEELPLGRVEKDAHIFLGLVDEGDKRMGGGVVAALIVGDRRKLGRCRHDAVECQRTASIFEENAWPLEGAALDMRKTATDLRDQRGFIGDHVKSP